MVENPLFRWMSSSLRLQVNINDENCTSPLKTNSDDKYFHGYATLQVNLAISPFVIRLTFNLLDRIISYIIYDDESYMKAKRENINKDDKSKTKDIAPEEIPT